MSAAGTPTSPAVSELTIAALDDGFPIKATLFAPSPSGAAGPAVLVSAATGVPRTFYAAFAQYLAERHGCAVLTYDYRGLGDSLPAAVGTQHPLSRLQHIHIHKEWAQNDQAAAVKHLHESFPGRPVVLVGQSVGCHIAPLNPLRHLVSRYVFISANNAYWGYSTSRLLTYSFPWLVETTSVVVAPWRPADRYFPARRFGLCDDLPLGIARDWAKWTRYPEYCTVEPDVKELYARFDPGQGNAIAIGFTDDDFCAGRVAFDSWLRLVPRMQAPLIYLHPQQVGLKDVGHMGFFKKCCQEGAWEPVAQFIVAGVEPRFSSVPAGQPSEKARAKL
ncbi:AB hydrolase-1 domain-containing protein [Plasmodiophora brassicae]